MIWGLEPIALIGFAITCAGWLYFEFRGVFSKQKGDTFSEIIWRLERQWAGLRWIVLGFLVWLAIHFFFSGRFG